MFAALHDDRAKGGQLLVQVEKAGRGLAGRLAGERPGPPGWRGRGRIRGIRFVERFRPAPEDHELSSHVGCTSRKDARECSLNAG